MKLIKRIIIGVGIVIFLELIALILFSTPGKKTSTVTPTPEQTTQPFYFHTPKKSSLSVVSTSPKDLAKNVDTTQSISVQFNKSFSDQDTQVSFAPSFPFQTKIINNTLFIIPSQPLLTNISYYGFVTIGGIPTYAFSFATVQDKTVTVAPDFANDVQTEINKHNYPDAFLSGFTPYTASTFTVVSNYTTDKPEHYFFVVTLFGDKTQASQDFVNWAEATGLTKEQLDTMDIRYN